MKIRNMILSFLSVVAISTSMVAKADSSDNQLIQDALSSTVLRLSAMMVDCKESFPFSYACKQYLRFDDNVVKANFNNEINFLTSTYDKNDVKKVRCQLTMESEGRRYNNGYAILFVTYLKIEDPRKFNEQECNTLNDYFNDKVASRKMFMRFKNANNE